jgi:hypothetical protein
MLFWLWSAANGGRCRLNYPPSAKFARQNHRQVLALND